jgi:hypothetical protein
LCFGTIVVTTLVFAKELLVFRPVSS